MASTHLAVSSHSAASFSIIVMYVKEEKERKNATKTMLVVAKNCSVNDCSMGTNS